MNFVALKMLVGDQSSQSGECTLKRKWHSRILCFREIWISVLALVAMSTVLAAGFVTSAGAQTTGSASFYLKRGIERYNARDFEAAIADFSEAIALHSGFVKRPAKNLTASNFKDSQNAVTADEARIV